MKSPFLVFSDEKGKIQNHPFLRMAVSSLDRVALADTRELISLPSGSTFFYLPSRAPVGFNPDTGKCEVVTEFKGRRVFAVGAFLIPGYLRLYNPAAVPTKRTTLPLWAYTACGFYAGHIYAAAKRVDRRVRQSPRFYDTALIKKEVRGILSRFSHNRLYKHLANCALNYNCLAAKNLFLKRWEAPLPTSRFCNAACIGCLSYQESDCASSHKRIAFKPQAFEIVEVMSNHLKCAREALVSFGQGCEGEPLLEADVIARAVREVRKKVSRGTINMNTNASFPEKIELLSLAGVDSFRVSLNSVQKKFYDSYFRPRNYKFSHVLKSIEIAKKYKKFVSVNLFVFPGVSDSETEIKELIKFVRETKIDMIQLRNLNIDPQYYLDSIPYKNLEPRGITYLIKVLQQKFPRLKIGYFNLPKEEFVKFK
jgi:pyruvate-formate lyase-activating enzyme